MSLSWAIVVHRKLYVTKKFAVAMTLVIALWLWSSEDYHEGSLPTFGQHRAGRLPTKY